MRNDLPAQVALGQIVGGKYRLDGVIGRGGVGVVFAATHVELDKRVAVKVLLDQSDPGRDARFRREAQAAAKVESAHVARVLDFGVTDAGLSYLVMEHLDGQSLADLCRERARLDVAQAVDIVAEACVGVAGAHAHRLVHRDLKPGNIFLAEVNGHRVVKILDFGLIKSLGEDVALTASTDAFGTPRYMAPEQLLAGRTVDERADQHALGMILFELISGESPFESETVTDQIVRIATLEAPRISAKGVLVPAPLDAAVHRALAKNPEDRYPSLTEFTAAIAPFGAVRAAAARDEVARVLTRGAPAPPPATDARDPSATGPVAPRPTRVTAATRELLGREQPCFGRAPEIARLTEIFDRAVGERRARAVLITGAAGIGKSRLRAELTKRLRARAPHALFVVGRGDPAQLHAPYGLASASLRVALGLREDEPRADAQRAIDRSVRSAIAPLPRAGDYVDRVTELLAELVGAPFEDAPFDDVDRPALRAARADPVRMGDQLVRAWCTFLDGATRQRPTVFVLDDVDFTDLPSLSLVDAALRNLHDRPLLVLGFARPEVDERFPRLWSSAPLVRMPLAELRRDASAELVRAGLGDQATPERVAWIVERGAGNPLYLEELVRAVATGGDATATPPNVMALVDARLRAVSADARRVTAAVSVFGRGAWRGAVLALSGMGDAACDAALDELFRREILFGRGVDAAGELEVAFRHALVRDAAYALLDPSARAPLHEAAGRWLATHRPNESFAIARHLDRAAADGIEGARDAAIAWFARASELALRGNDFASAVSSADLALARGADGALAAKLELLVSDCERHRGGNARMVARAERALDIFIRGSEGFWRALGNVVLGAIRLGERELLARCMADLERLLSEHAASPAPQPLSAQAARVAHFLHFAGHHDLASRLLGAAWDLRPGAEDDANAQRAAWFHRASATRALMTGDLGDYLAHLLACADAFERAGDVREPINERANAGFAQMELGLYAEAEATLSRAAHDAGELGLAHNAAVAAENLGAVLTRLGRLDEARPILEDAVATFNAQKNVRMEGNARIYLGACLERSGDLRDAEDQYCAAIQLLETVKTALPFALAHLARLLRRGDRLAEAMTAAQRAWSAMVSVEHVDEGEALIRLVHAQLVADAGDLDGARAELAVARERIVERAARIEDPRWREAFLAVEENAETLRERAE